MPTTTTTTTTTTTMRAGADRYVRVGDLSVHYRDWGRPTGSPAIVVHGIMGHSLGAMAAAICAADRPDLVRRLVLVDLAMDAFGTAFPDELSQTLTVFAGARYPDVETVVAEWLAANPRARPELMRHYVRHCLVAGADGRLRWRFDGAGLAGFLHGGVSASQLWQALDRIVAPTLVLRGRHSELLSPATAGEMIRCLRRGMGGVIAGAGHDMGVERPEAVAAAALGCLRP